MHEVLMDLGASTKEVRRLLVAEVKDDCDARGKKLSVQQRLAKQSFNKALQNGLMREIEVGCPVCGEQTFDNFCAIDRIGLKVQSVMCTRCPTLYSRKRFDEQSLAVFYSKFYREMYTGSSVPTTGWFEDQVLSGRKILGQLKELGVVSQDLSGKCVLEVGCGSGGILIPFTEIGADVIGIDFDDTYMEAGRKRGLNLIGRSIYEFQTATKFDLIILKDVIEHLPDLNLVLQKLKRLLSESGSVYIQVPTFEGLEFLGYKNDFLRYFQNAHIVHFSEVSLKYVFAKNGFDVTYSNINGLAVFKHADQAMDIPFDLENERNNSLRRIVDILNRRRRVSAKERIWKLLPKQMIHWYHLVQERGSQG
jgi:2-polyprenyl-3-methyl-5-hydroxy-6-metoxy-1,4-benzoquinol methylase